MKARGNFVLEEVIKSIRERLSVVKRGFKNILCLCPDVEGLMELLAQRYPDATIHWAAPGEFESTGARRPDFRYSHSQLNLPLEKYDLVVSPLALHWENDLPGVLAQIRLTMRPGGLFLGALYGESHLHELRTAFLEAAAVNGRGGSPRIIPMVTIQQAAQLLQRAGFALPVSDLETLQVQYKDPMGLLADLKEMAETNALIARHNGLTGKGVFEDMSDIYRDRFSVDSEKVIASFEMIFMTGWAHEAV